MAGYFNYSKSNNAMAAEQDGRYPLSRAVPIVAQAAGVTRQKAREALLAVGSHEWHHVSKKFNRVDYYDTGEAVRWLVARPIVARLEAIDYVARINAAFASVANPDNVHERIAAFGACAATLAAEAACTPEDVQNAYYDDWA